MDQIVPSASSNAPTRRRARLPSVEIQEVEEEREGDIPVASSLPPSRTVSPCDSPSSLDVPLAFIGDREPELFIPGTSKPIPSTAHLAAAPTPVQPRTFPLTLLALTGLPTHQPEFNGRQTISSSAQETTTHLSNVLQSSDDPGIDPSSPIRGRTRGERISSRKRKIAKARRREREEREEQEEWLRKVASARDAREVNRVRRMERQAAREKKQQAINNVLAFMKTQDVAYGELLEYLSDPRRSSGTGRIRHYGLFAVEGQVERVLDNWVSSRNSDTGRNAVRNWIRSYVSRELNTEGNKVTKSGILLASHRKVDESFVLDFDIRALYAQLREYCPWTVQLLESFGTSTRQRQKLKAISKAGSASARFQRFEVRHEKHLSGALFTLLRARSERNSYPGQVLGVYAYTTGAERQLITVCSHLGMCCSYPTITGTGSQAARQTQSSLVSNSATTQPLLPSERSSDLDYVPSTSVHEGSTSDGELTSDTDQSSIWSDENASSSSATSDSDSGSSSSLRSDSPSEHSETMSGSANDSKPASQTITRPTKTTKTHSRRGLLQQLSDSSRENLRYHAQAPLDASPLGNVYDNINFMFRAAEQILGRKDSQENGTCATAFTLYDAPREHMRTADYIASFQHAPPLAFDDICLSSDEDAHLRERLIWTVMNIIVHHGETSLSVEFKDDVAAHIPASPGIIPLHKTEIFPMPAMHIDESSTTGNAEVLDAMFEEMGYELTSPEFTEEVRLVFGDQLSMARVRGVTHARVGHDEPSRAYLNVAFAPGFFHYQMAATHGLLETYWGDPAHDPGSLHFHNTRIDRKPILLSSLPPYRVCRDLIFVSLYARVLHCLELISETPLERYASKFTYDDLYRHAAAIVDQYANANNAQKARLTDNVYANAVLFLRDGLLLRHFADAIKAGRSDHMVTVLKLWTLGFRAMGRAKYAHELLHLIHNIVHVWPPELRAIIMKNWLVNTTGHPNGFIPVDLLQEHLNYWIKVVYQAHGSNASWEWLATIAPCINTLRQLASQIHAELGSHQGSKHAAPDLSKDIATLMASLRDHKVYVKEHDRRSNEHVTPVLNVYSAGINSLAGPIADYNTLFTKMKARRAKVPLIGKSVVAAYGAEQVLADEPLIALAAAPNADMGMEDASDEDELLEDLSDVSDEADLEDAEEIGVSNDVLFSLETADDVSLDMDGY